MISYRLIGGVILILGGNILRVIDLHSAVCIMNSSIRIFFCQKIAYDGYLFLFATNQTLPIDRGKIWILMSLKSNAFGYIFVHMSNILIKWPFWVFCLYAMKTNKKGLKSHVDSLPIYGQTRETHPCAYMLLNWAFFHHQVAPVPQIFIVRVALYSFKFLKHPPRQWI